MNDNKKILDQVKIAVSPKKTNEKKGIRREFEKI